MPLSNDEITQIRNRVVLSINNVGIILAANKTPEGADRIRLTIYEAMNRHSLSELATKLASLPVHIELSMARVYQFIDLEFFCPLDPVPEYPEYRFLKF